MVIENRFKNYLRHQPGGLELVLKKYKQSWDQFRKALFFYRRVCFILGVVFFLEFYKRYQDKVAVTIL